MELFLFLLVIIFVLCRLSLRRKQHYDTRKQPGSEQSIDRKDTDDFAGGSIGAFFLLEEIVDQGAGRQDSSYQELVKTEQSENDCFHDEFFE